MVEKFGDEKSRVGKFMVEKSGVEMSFNRLFFLENLKMTRKRVKKVKLALAWIYFCDFR